MKTKIVTSLFLGIMWLTGSLSHAQNILTDGEFSTTTTIIPFNTPTPPLNVWCSWLNYYGTGADGSANVLSGVCNYQIFNPGINTWDVQLVQWGFPLTPGHSYRLTFDVKADVDRSFGVFIGEDGGSYTNLNASNYTQFASQSWGKITIDFNATCVYALHKLSFELGVTIATMYFDNILLEDMGAYTPSVGIIGTSVNGWDTDVDMLTTDGTIYTLSNYPLSAGSMKFRQDNMWCVNWGGSDFPTGSGYQDGPDILVSNLCNYDITFNRTSGEYSFTNPVNCAAGISIIGSAVSPNYDWNTDVKMLTKDQITYTLTNYQFAGGEAKFRKDNSWDINWGNSSFPTGIADLYGANIPVTAGTYNVAFNVISGEYSFTPPVIGIIGSALIGWNDDIEMQTTDGINYTLTDYPFLDGEVKFRADKSWVVNWGGNSFPSGWAYSYGPNIPVPAGNYNVAFNMITGEYNFVSTTCPVPAILCPSDLYMPSSPGICGTNVFYQEIIQANNCGGKGVSITQTAGLPNGSLFPVGITTNTFVLTNESGKTATCSFNVIVFDIEPPVISDIDTHITPFWPPNHKMICVKIDYNSSDNCSITNCDLSVSSNNPMVDEHGYCDKQPDWVILDKHHVLLRAEKERRGHEREYTITITCTDGSNNTSIQQVVVTIPHDKRDPHDRRDFGGEYCRIKIVNHSNGSSCTKSENIDLNAGKDILNEGLSFNVSIWPNPTIQNFYLKVESGSNENIEVFIMDATGRILSKQYALPEQSMHFGDDLLPGIYFIKVKQNDNYETIKVMKQ